MNQWAKVTIATTCAVLVIVLWMTFGRGESRLPDVDSERGPVAGTDAAIAEPETTTPSAEPPRERVAPPAPAAVAATGSLVVLVSWADDGPAVDVPIFLRPPGSGRWAAVVWQRRTDHSGRARFVDLPPGRVVVSANRGRDYGGLKTVAIEAGKEHELRLELAAGVTVAGTVVDVGGSPVPRADVVVSGWAAGGAAALTQTDEAGRFELRGLRPNCSVGARAAGHMPSLLQTLTAKDGSSVEIRIVLPARGGGLACIVFDPDGLPVRGAIVRAGVEGRQANPQKMADGSHGRLIPQQKHTDASGRAHFPGVAAGVVPVAAWTRGFSPWRGSAEVLVGQTAERTIRLQLPATLVGTVRDASNRPHSGLYLIVGRHGTLAHRTTKTDGDGNYRVDGVPLGEFRVEVQGNGVHKFAKVVGVAGQTVRWDPELPATRSVPGRLLGTDGRGVAKAMIEGYAQGWLRARTDEEGRFTLKNVVAGVTLRLTARQGSVFFPTEVFDDRPPDDGELILRLSAEQLPSVRIAGKLVDLDGAPVTNASLSPQLRGYGNTTVYKTKADGSFDYGPYPPGEYRLLVRAKGWAIVRTPWRHLRRDEVAELGEIRLEKPGTLAVQLKGTALPGKVSFSIYTSRGALIDGIRVENGSGSVGGLSSGKYRLQLRGKGLAAAVVPFVIHPGGATTRLDVPARSGVPVTLAVRAAGGGRRSRRVDFEVVDAAGTAVIQMLSRSLRKDGSLWGDFELAPGKYRARVAAGNRRGKLAFDVTAGSGNVSVVVPMR